jgi:hypothetical protein
MKHIVLSGTLKIWAKAAIQISTVLNRSSSKWLKIAQEQTFFVYGITLKIMGYSETRWNSLQMLFASLLRIRGALKMFAAGDQTSDDFPEELLYLDDNDFWTNLVRLEKLIRPLAAASFLMEKNSCNMADCVHIYAVLFIEYAEEPEAKEELEKRWANLEHPLFLLAYLLHPKYAGVCRKLLETVENRNGKLFFDKSRMIRAAQFYFVKYMSPQTQESINYFNSRYRYLYYSDEKLYSRDL